MEHDGKNLRKAVAAAGISVKRFAEMMGVGRNTPSRWYASDSLPIDKLVEASMVLEHDPAALFPRLLEMLPGPVRAESTGQMDLVHADRDVWKKKAYQYMEKYNRLLEMHAKLLKSRLQSPESRRSQSAQNSRFATFD